MLKESYDNLEDFLKSNLSQDSQQPIPPISEHQLYFFGLSGDAADQSYQAERDLKIKDLVECKNGQQSGLQLKYPVCFECFENIIRGMETKIH